jgi:spore coat protein JB
MDDRERLMKNIQDLSFAKDEAILFLDTHPDCTGAMDYFRDIMKNLDTYMAEYQNKYGPIYHEGALGERWAWSEGAWPWQNEDKGEKR